MIRRNRRSKRKLGRHPRLWGRLWLGDRLRYFHALWDSRNSPCAAKSQAKGSSLLAHLAALCAITIALILMVARLPRYRRHAAESNSLMTLIIPCGARRFSFGARECAMSQQLHGQVRLSRALDPTNSCPATRLYSRTDILEIRALTPPRWQFRDQL